MSLHPQAIAPIPEETARVAHAAFPNGNTSPAWLRELDAIETLRCV